MRTSNLFVRDGSVPVREYAVSDALLEKRGWMDHGSNASFVRYQLESAAKLGVTITADVAISVDRSSPPISKEEIQALNGARAVMTLVELERWLTEYDTSSASITPSVTAGSALHRCNAGSLACSATSRAAAPV